MYFRAGAGDVGARDVGGKLLRDNRGQENCTNARNGTISTLDHIQTPQSLGASIGT